ncbi:actin [Diplonema papillatum]|nr:actin [Diplonema papillatum]
MENGERLPQLVIEFGNTIRVGVGGEAAPDVHRSSAVGVGPDDALLELSAESLQDVPVEHLMPDSHLDYTLKESDELRLAAVLSECKDRLPSLRRVERFSTTAIVPFYASDRFREQVLDICAGSLASTATFLIAAPAATVYACGMTSGLVVDCATKITSACPVSRGVARRSVSQLGRIGGDSVTQAILAAIGEENLLKSAAGVASPTAREWCVHELADRVKQMYCYVPTDGELPAQGQQIFLPDGTAITLTPEQLTAPSYLVGMSSLGSVPQLLRSTVNSCLQEVSLDIDANSLLSDALIIMGGVSLTRGFIPRLNRALVDMFPSHSIQTPIAHFDPSERRIVPWIGGSLVAQYLPPELWITQEEYQEEGRRIVHKKCPA